MLEKIKKYLKEKKEDFEIFFGNLNFTQKALFALLLIVLIDIVFTIFRIITPEINIKQYVPTSIQKQIKSEERISVTLSEFKKKEYLETIEKMKLIKSDKTFLEIEYTKKDEPDTIYFVKSVPTIGFVNNYEDLFIEANVDYEWVQKSNDKFLNKFLILNELKENAIRIVIIFVIIFLLEQQGLFSNKDKYKIVSSKDIKGDMDELVGLEDIKIEILQLADMIKNKEKYFEYGLDKTFNIMFSGPAGTGKTKIASLLAKRLEVPIIVGTGNVETGYVNGGANVIKELFDKAREMAQKNEHKTCILFLDEAQTLLIKRGGSREKWADDSANELLAQLDGINTKTELNIVFIAASNFDDQNHNFDEAMMRRFKKKIFFRKPNTEERIDILKLYISKIDKKYLCEDIDFEYLSEIMSGLSPAIIETIVQESSLISINEKKIINTELIERGFERITVGLTDRKKSKEKDKIRHIIAKHEMGHFITEYQIEMDKLIKRDEFEKINIENKIIYIDKVKKELNTLKISVESIAQINALGYVLNKDSGIQLKTKEDLEAEIISLYGGLAAEHVFFDDNNVTTGSANDIEKISKLFDLMVNKLGMYSNNKLNYKFIENVNVESSNMKILTEQSERLYNISKQIIEDNKEMIEFISNELEKRYILTLNEVLELIKDFYKKNEKKLKN